MADGADTKTIHRTLRHGDTVTVRDADGIIVVETRTYGDRVRQAITFPAGGWIEHNGERLDATPQVGQ